MQNVEKIAAKCPKTRLVSHEVYMKPDYRCLNSLSLSLSLVESDLSYKHWNFLREIPVKTF